MTFTEIKGRNSNKYYYRVLSVRKAGKVSKKRKYLGVNLSETELMKKEKLADDELNTKKMPKDLKELIPKIVSILKKYKIKKAGIFGSYARGNFKKSSDVDIIIQPAEGMGLEFVGLALELEDKLNKKIDLITYKSIHPLIRKNVMNGEVKII